MITIILLLILCMLLSFIWYYCCRYNGGGLDSTEMLVYAYKFDSVIIKYVNMHRYPFESGVYLGTNIDAFAKTITEITRIVRYDNKKYSIVENAINTLNNHLILCSYVDIDLCSLIHKISTFIYNMNNAIQFTTPLDLMSDFDIKDFNDIKNLITPPVINFNPAKIKQFANSSRLLTSAEWSAIILYTTPRQKLYTSAIVNKILSDRNKLWHIKALTLAPDTPDLREYIKHSKIFFDMHKINIDHNIEFNRSIGIYNNQPYVIFGRLIQDNVIYCNIPNVISFVEFNVLISALVVPKNEKYAVEILIKYKSYGKFLLKLEEKYGDQITNAIHAVKYLCGKNSSLQNILVNAKINNQYMYLFGEHNILLFCDADYAVSKSSIYAVDKHNRILKQLCS